MLCHLIFVTPCNILLHHILHYASITPFTENLNIWQISFAQKILYFLKITIDMDKEFHEDLPMHPDLNSILSYSEDIEENSVPQRKRKLREQPS